MYVFNNQPRGGKETEWVAQPVWAWWRKKIFMPGIELQSPIYLISTPTNAHIRICYLITLKFTLKHLKSSYMF